MASPILALAQELIRLPSVTPEDAGCQKILATRLQKAGFHSEHLRFGEVDNLWAVHGSDGPLFCFLGHTDVVPTGPETEWQHPPFAATIDGGELHGRGAADMKGSVAAMIVAGERFVSRHGKHRGRVAFLLTSDEEGPAVNGTAKVVEELQRRGEQIRWCLVGEPTCSEHFGGMIKNGRRGSLSAVLTVHGTQGHIAYPEQAINPIQTALPALQALDNEAWDEGNAHFPPTSFQFSNVQAGVGAHNVIPGEMKVMFNFRYSTESDAQSLRQRSEHILQSHNVDFRIEWQEGGKPFLTEHGELLDTLTRAVRQHTGQTPVLTTVGGTSDGRYIAPTGSQVAEFGPINSTIHRIDERVSIEDLERLSTIYEEVLTQLLTGE